MDFGLGHEWPTPFGVRLRAHPDDAALAGFGFPWACPKGTDNFSSYYGFDPVQSILPASAVRSGSRRNGRRMQGGWARMRSCCSSWSVVIPTGACRASPAENCNELGPALFSSRPCTFASQSLACRSDSTSPIILGFAAAKTAGGSVDANPLVALIGKVTETLKVYPMASDSIR